MRFISFALFSRVAPCSQLKILIQSQALLPDVTRVFLDFGLIKLRIVFSQYPVYGFKSKVNADVSKSGFYLFHANVSWTQGLGDLPVVYCAKGFPSKYLYETIGKSAYACGVFFFYFSAILTILSKAIYQVVFLFQGIPNVTKLFHFLQFCDLWSLFSRFDVNLIYQKIKKSKVDSPGMSRIIRWQLKRINISSLFVYGFTSQPIYSW